jgi:hypothetical protein
VLTYPLLISSTSYPIGNPRRQSSHQRHQEQPGLESSRRPFHVLKPYPNYCFLHEVVLRYFQTRSFALERNDSRTIRQTIHLRLYNIYGYLLYPPVLWPPLHWLPYQQVPLFSVLIFEARDTPTTRTSGALSPRRGEQINSLDWVRVILSLFPLPD